MAKKSYPCIGAAKKLTQAKGICIVCKAPATYRIDIQFSIFRGDDEVVKACDIHKNDCTELVKARFPK